MSNEDVKPGSYTVRYGHWEDPKDSGVTLQNALAHADWLYDDDGRVRESLAPVDAARVMVLAKEVWRLQRMERSVQAFRTRMLDLWTQLDEAKP